MNNKILSIFICTLLIATATLPVVTSMNDEKMSSVKSVDNVYSENFILAQEDKMLTLGGDFPSSWTITEVVSTESNSFSWLASLAVDSAGMVHVAWQDLTNYNGSGTDYDIFYKCKPSGGSWPTTTEVVSTESTSNSGTPCLAVDSTGMVHVAWVDVTNYNGSGTDADIFYKSKSSGGSWPTTTEVVSTESTRESVYPCIAVDSAGMVHVAWHDITNYSGSGLDNDIFYKCKPSGGSWPTTTEVVSTESTDSSVEPSLDVDSAGMVHVAWTDLTNYSGSGTHADIFYKSKSSGGSWPTTTEVVSTESTLGSYVPSLAVDSAGMVHVAWADDTNYSGSGIHQDIFYKCKPSGGSWPTTTEVVSTESVWHAYYPFLAVDSASIVHVTWYDQTIYGGSGADMDIFYKCKPSGGSWPTTTEVVSTESNYSSMFPCLAVDSAGMVHVAWDDSTDYGGSGTDNDIFYKYKPNNPPSAPNITGPPSGRIGKEYCWDFHSNDTDGDIIKYIIDWGDGTTTETDCVEPCTPVKECHTYTKQGSYNITAIAKECEYGLESDESTFKVTIPRIRTVYHPLLVWFLERFPFLERLLGLIRVI